MHFCSDIAPKLKHFMCHASFEIVDVNA